MTSIQIIVMVMAFIVIILICIAKLLVIGDEK